MTGVNISAVQFATNDAVMYAELDGEAVLLNIETGVYFGLDPLGTQIWQSLAEGVDPDEIIERLLDEYEVERSRVQADVRAFLENLQRNGLIVVAGA